MYNLFFESKLGWIEIVADETSVFKIHLTANNSTENPNAVCLEMKKELISYLDNKLKAFTVPLKLVGTDFQKQVWQALIKISFGEIISYQNLATKMGKRSAVRAVANAVGANPLLIVVPCHRVIGTNHTLTGFSAGLENKVFLLTLEGHHLKTNNNLSKSKLIN